jgi:hypothetical protein
MVNPRPGFTLSGISTVVLPRTNTELHPLAASTTTASPSRCVGPPALIREEVAVVAAMAAIAIGTEKLASPVAARHHDQPGMVQPQRAQRFGHNAAGGQQMRKRFSPQGDLHPFDLGEIAEADLTRLVGQRDHQLRRWGMEGLPVLIWFCFCRCSSSGSHLRAVAGSPFGQGQRTLLSGEGSRHDPVPCAWQPSRFGATRPLNQIVVGHIDQLQGVPQAKGAQQRVAVGALAARRKYWGASSPLPDVSMGHGPIHERSALFWSGLQGKQVTQVGGVDSTAGPQKNRACSALCLGLTTHSGFRMSPGMTSDSYADDEGPCFHLARIRP